MGLGHGFDNGYTQPGALLPGGVEGLADPGQLGPGHALASIHPIEAQAHFLHAQANLQPRVLIACLDGMIYQIPRKDQLCVLMHYTWHDSTWYECFVVL